jgi:hypothetical protein
MKIKLLSVALLAATILNAQSDSTGFRALQIKTGAFAIFNTGIDYQTMLKFLDEKYIPADLPINSSTYYGTSSGSPYLSIEAEFLLKNKNIRPFENVLRIGISHFGSSILNFSNHKTDRYRIDTAVSSSNQVFYLDSISEQSFNVNYERSNLLLNLSYLFSSVTQSRWSFYGGVNAGIGISLNSRSEIRTYRNDYVEGSSQNIREDDFSDSYDFVQQKNGIVLQTSIPLGLHFRLGKEVDFWKNSSLIAEINPGLSHFYIPELNDFKSHTSIAYLFGYRYAFQ